MTGAIVGGKFDLPMVREEPSGSSTSRHLT